MAAHALEGAGIKLILNGLVKPLADTICLRSGNGMFTVIELDYDGLAVT
jgi:hypothetical protein